MGNLNLSEIVKKLATIDERTLGTFVAEVAERYEQLDPEIKRKYLQKNIDDFNTMCASMEQTIGTFGTGYPFYVLDENLEGNLPPIDEQSSYNQSLKKAAEEHGDPEKPSRCVRCATTLINLKTPCKTCTYIHDRLKPRGINNTLPDLDMWVIVPNGELQNSSERLIELFEAFNFHSSDVNPLSTIREIAQIVDALEKGIIPEQHLPIDAHIIEYDKLKKAIKEVPTKILNMENPFYPIDPLSYRKQWQHDDKPYNFAQDFLLTFRPYVEDPTLKREINNARFILARQLTPIQLIDIIKKMASDSLRRRMKTQDIIKNLERKFTSWCKLSYQGPESPNSEHPTTETGR